MCRKTKSIYLALQKTFCFVLTSTLVFCSSGCTPEQDSFEERVGPDNFFPIELGSKTLHLQLALNDAERTLGLMFRDEIAENHGMLFLFEKPALRNFWMRNTKIPIDLGYFDATGKLLELHKLYPYDETPVASRSKQVLIAIETNRGWFKANDIRPGAQIDLNALIKAMQSRKVLVKNYPIQISSIDGRGS